MKKLRLLFSAALALLIGFNANAQMDTAPQADTSKKEAPKKAVPASPPASVTQTLANGKVVTINYAQPGIKGRTIGKEIAPFDKVWRTGANAATQFEISEDVKINGKVLPAGKYSLFTIPTQKEWTVIFNKTWNQWGSFKYDEAQDALRINVKSVKTKEFVERMVFFIDKSGKVSLQWGDYDVDFMVK